MTRTEIIQLLIDKFGLKRYLEIGIFDGKNFKAINAEEKYSIDPNFPARFEMTSDQFFLQLSHDPQVLNGNGWDLVFIDGMHTAEQAYRDIVNSKKYLNDGGFIVVHDCNPATEWHTRPPEEYKRGQEWNGDTYLALIQFKQENTGLTCFTVDTDYGCGIITDRPLLKNMPVLFHETWDYFDNHRAELLQLVDVGVFKDLI